MCSSMYCISVVSWLILCIYANFISEFNCYCYSFKRLSYEEGSCFRAEESAGDFAFSITCQGKPDNGLQVSTIGWAMYGGTFELDRYMLALYQAHKSFIHFMYF